eukprot:RCo006708
MASCGLKRPYAPATNSSGEFVRKESQFRHWVRKDGSTPYPPEPQRYHLYVAYACPWAHRCLVVRALKGLEKVISVDVVDYLLEDGWVFEHPDRPQASKDTLFGAKSLMDIYKTSDPQYTGRATVPVLFDRKTQKIVNNESSEIIQMLNSEFNTFAENPSLDLYPDELKAKVDEINAWVYPMINNGVYRSGFASSQAAYDSAVKEVFEGLDRAEKILSQSRYLTGDRLTLADIRLFTTLLRFDPVYFTHFKVNLRRLAEYPSLLGFTRELYQMPGIKATVDMEQIKKHYFVSHRSINPHGIVPVGPEIDYDTPHGR